MPAQGTTTINFGAFPGDTSTNFNVTGQTGISNTSLVEAWLYPANTADHTLEEHLLDNFTVYASNINTGVGFTIYATTADDTPRYGQWFIAWVWNG